MAPSFKRHSRACPGHPNRHFAARGASDQPSHYGYRARISPVADWYYAIAALYQELIGEWFQSSNMNLAIRINFVQGASCAASTFRRFTKG
jgi:hypothetical protein